jgi:hypothetical protein
MKSMQPNDSTRAIDAPTQRRSPEPKMPVFNDLG